MDVRLSTEQRALRDSVAQVVGHLGPATVGALDDAERTAKLDAAVAAAGWRDLRSADDDGRPWASGVEVAVIAEQLGRGLADTAFVGATLAAELRRLAGAKAATVPETVLLTADLGALAVTPTGAVAIDAAGATAALVLVTEGAGWSLGSVTLDGPAMHTDLTRPAAVPAGAGVTPLAEQGRCLDDDDLARVLALGLAATSADLVGAMQGTTDLATGYAKERRQYGAPIGSFQAVQHLLADALVTTEGARSVGLHAAWAVDALDPHEAVAAGAVAKAYAARAARTACEASVQVHGGIGNTWECLAHVFLRRSLLSTDVFGGVDANLARVLDHELGTEADRGLR
jgi:Acyl-CoA dehydrogenase, C-terminal domain